MHFQNEAGNEELKEKRRGALKRTACEAGLGLETLF
jgi:hypothetical protein